MLSDIEISLAVQILRERTEMTARELSVKAGLPDYTISRIETGKLRVDFLTAMRLADAFGITLDEMARTAQTLDPTLLTMRREMDVARKRIANLRAEISS